MRSNRENREQEKGGVASLRKWLDKSSTSFSATYLKHPKGASLFQPKAGIMLLDIIPYKVGEGNPNADEDAIYLERTFFVHPRIGANQSAYLCPARTSNEACPICEFRAKHWTQDLDPSEEKFMKDLLPKQRQLFNVMDLKNPDKGIQIWDISYYNFGERLQEEINTADEDSGWDLFYHWSKGFTLKIGFGEETMGKGRPFLRATTIHFRDRKEQYEKSIIDDAYCLDKLLIQTEYDELKEVFLQTMNKSTDDDDDPPAKKKRKPVDNDDLPMDDDPPRKKSREVDDDDPPRRKRDDDDDSPAKKKRTDDDDDDPPRKSKKGDEDGWDDFDEPKKKKRVDDDDDPPKKRKVDDDDDDPPRKKKPVDDDDDPPRKKRDDDDDDPPRKKRDADDDDDRPRVRSRDADDDDDRPKKKKPADDEDGWDAPAPSKKRKVVDDD